MDKLTEQLSHRSADAIIGSDGYNSLMQGILDSFMTGAIARILTLLLIGMALWFALRREQLGVGFLFAVLAMFMLFGHNVMHWIGLV